MPLGVALELAGEAAAVEMGEGPPDGGGALDAFGRADNELDFTHDYGCTPNGCIMI